MVVAGIEDWPAFCRDCLSDAKANESCPACGSTRVLAHPELDILTIAHMDCDAFYAAIEKRDDPSLNDKPLKGRNMRVNEAKPREARPPRRNAY